DGCRVRLTPLDGEPHSHYVNTSFIHQQGYTRPQEFITTQGLLKKTLEDFWQLAWEQQVRVVVMLTAGMESGRVLREHHWPADSTPVTHGHIVHLLAEEPEDEWTARDFQMQHVRTRERGWTVKQLQFTTRPDHSIPETPSSLLAFVDPVRERRGARPGAGRRGRWRVAGWAGEGPRFTALGPLTCSAGMGRSDTFVALSGLPQQLGEEDTVDVFHTVCALHLHRPLMIQTPSQYIFLHGCLLSRVLEGAP
ncbi:hypothetical protein DBR06_SOUSAS6810154, partial [Sousa chinensis]